MHSLQNSEYLWNVTFIYLLGTVGNHPFQSHNALCERGILLQYHRWGLLNLLKSDDGDFPGIQDG